jgi:hypothetical protein
MAVSASTASNLVVGAGDVFLDAADVGATTDSNTFAVETEWYVPELNGVPGELQGTRYKSSETVRLGVTVVELTGAKLIAALPGWDTAVAGTITTIDTDDTRRVATADYHDWILQVDGLDGKQFNFYADNAVNDGGLEFEASDDGTMGYRAELISTWDGADITTSPYRIKIITGVSS